MHKKHEKVCSCQHYWVSLFSGSHLKVVQTFEIIYVLGDRISALHSINLGIDHHQHLGEEGI